MVEQTFLGKFMGGYFMLGQMIRSCRGWKVNTTIRGSNLKNTCTLFLKVWGFHVKPVFFFLKKILVTCSLMSWGSFRFTYLWAKLMEKWVKALHSESEESQTPGDLGVKRVSSTVFNIGLLKLPLDSGPKLAVGQWIAWWSGFPRGSSSSCDI